MNIFLIKKKCMYNTNTTESQTVNISTNSNVNQNVLNVELQNKLKYLVSSFELKLTQNQQKALTNVWQFIHSSEHFFLLAGYAGTGKSTIVFAVIKELVRLGKRVALTAPTNKAVEVVRNIAFKQGLAVDCFTIHQLLGLSIVDNRGK